MGKVKTCALDLRALEKYRERVEDCWKKVKPYCVPHAQGDAFENFLVEFINKEYEEMFLPMLKEVLYTEPEEYEPLVHYFYNGSSVYAIRGERAELWDDSLMAWFKQHYPEYVKETEKDD